MIKDLQSLIMQIGKGSLEVVKKSEAKNVFFHHGDSEALSKYLVEKESINVLLFGK